VTGEIAQTCTLVSFGNAFLRGIDEIDRAVASAWPFKATELGFAWRIGPAALPLWQITLRDPRAWYRRLARSGVSRFELIHFAPAAAEDHAALAAFVGGAGTWLIATYRSANVCLWRNRWQLLDRSAAHGARWKVTYRGATVPHDAIRADPVDVGWATRELGRAVAAASELARNDAELRSWDTRFERARAALESDEPAKLLDVRDNSVLAPAIHRLEARRLVAAAQCAWVFGGMGSWNDYAGADGESRARHRSVTADLYAAVVDAIVGGVNSVA
jgi:hypothetical protein